MERQTRDIARGLGDLLRFLLVRPHLHDSWGRCRAWSWLMAMAAGAVMHGRAYVEFTQVQAGSLNAVKDYQRALFWQGRGRMFLTILKMIGSSTVQNYAANKLKILWRSAATASLLQKYLGKDTYYRAKLTGAVPNPDHRIASDVQSVVEDVTNMSKMLPEHVTNVVGLTGAMWRTSRFACGLLWSYVICVTLATRVHFERRTAQLELAVQAVEAHFRFALLRVQDCAESIAFHKSASTEHARLLQMVQRLVVQENALLVLTSVFGSIERTCSWVASILPSMIMAPRYWAGLARFADYSLMVNGFRKVKDALFFLADHYDKLAAITARVGRVQELHLYSSAGNIRANERITVGEPPCGLLLVLEAVRVAVPGMAWEAARWLGPHEGVSFRLAPGGTLLVQGESGVGKSSLLRAIAGLWEEGSGAIHRGSEVLFLPQVPYLPAGPQSAASSLRSQLLYPAARATEPELRHVLQEVQLEHLADDLDREVDWATTLSGGERQRLVFARLLVSLAGAASPVVLLDEATSACSEAAEERLYAALLQRLGSGALVSVGHRSSLRRFHSEVHVMG